MLIRFTPRALLSTFVNILLISSCWLYFKNSEYDASALWDAAVSYAERQPGRTGPDGADEPAPKLPGPQDERFPSIANSFGENRARPERVWKPKEEGYNYTKVLVVPRMKEDVQWVEGLGKELGMQTKIYELKEKNDNKVPKNKGKEAMAYLTYIIDHYSELPDIILFFHASRQAWHNNLLLDIDSVLTIKRLNPARVDRLGYMNARCHLDPGCPNWLHLDRPSIDLDLERKPEEQYLSKSIWRELFPGSTPPSALSQPCCAQFAVSRDAVLQHPKSRYIYFRDWLLNTPLKDNVSGRLFEYVWQYIFTGQSELCPIMNSCYCDGYGVCFGGAAKLDAWLEKVRKLEEMQKRVDDEKTPEGEKAELREGVARLEEETRREKQEAYERGEDEKNRAVERERLD